MKHAVNYLPLPSTRLLIVGYQADETVGRQIIEGDEVVEIDGKQVEIKASIREIHSLSAHADQSQLVKWLEHIEGVVKVILTHGEDESRVALAEEIRQRVGIGEVDLPQLNQTLDV